ncbi:EAL domain-containing protein [Rossellomorea aquimaris]|uniref:EAL domain-containing protein n=1 Tax=Rossellomorea aquimaris TaxID=189382 RepID=UPI0005C904EB|nr:EAL domain-containing protein [Rossellomorea aquimaris]
MNIFTIFQNNYIYHDFQPLYEMGEQQTLFAYEGLLRNKYNENPESVFQSAMKANILYKLDTLSISKALESFSENGLKTCKLFLNIYITTILHPSFHTFFYDLMKKHPEIKGRLVLEINESSAEELWQNPLLKESLKELKQYGVWYAIDDFGQGTSSIKKSIEYEPEIIKLDRFFALNLSQDDKKQRFLSFFNQFYGKDTLIVLEGIETKQDMQVAKDIGITMGQGFYLGRPSRLLA